MAQNSQASSSITTVLFMSVWLSFWSVGVGVISAMVAGNPGMLLFLFSHGGAEVFVARQVTKSYLKAARESLREPTIKQDLDGLTASWGPRPRLYVLQTLFALLGVVVMTLLLGGTWWKFDPAQLGSLVVAVPLSVVWGLVGWWWINAFREMIGFGAKTSLDASFDQVKIQRRGWLVATDHQFETQHTTVMDSAEGLEISDGKQTLLLPCPASSERDHLINTLREAAARARANPTTDVPIPAELDALRQPVS